MNAIKLKQKWVMWYFEKTGTWRDSAYIYRVAYYILTLIYSNNFS